MYSFHVGRVGFLGLLTLVLAWEAPRCSPLESDINTSEPQGGGDTDGHQSDGDDADDGVINDNEDNVGGEGVVVTLPPGGPGSATQLQSQTGCVGSQGVARLSWTLAANRGTQQRVQVTILPDAFDRGEAEVSAPIGPGEVSLTWDGLRGQAIHYWRVLTLQPEGWVPSEISSFEGPTCVSDEISGATQPAAADAPVVAVGGPGAASALQSQPGCDDSHPGQALAKLTWTPADRQAQAQRVDVTIYPDGFDRGKFERSSLLSPDRDSLVWTELRGQAFHYWRVLSQQADGWVASETASFEGPTCISDCTR